MTPLGYNDCYITFQSLLLLIYFLWNLRIWKNNLYNLSNLSWLTIILFMNNHFLCINANSTTNTNMVMSIIIIALWADVLPEGEKLCQIYFLLRYSSLAVACIILYNNFNGSWSHLDFYLSLEVCFIIIFWIVETFMNGL